MRIPQSIFCFFLIITTITTSKANIEPNKKTPLKATHSIKKQVAKWVKLNKFSKAERLLKESISQHSVTESLPLRYLLAKLYHSQQDFVNEAATYHDILQLRPTDKQALQGRSIAMVRMGAPTLASKLAEKNSAAFTTKTLHQLKQARVGSLIRWGILEAKNGIGSARYHSIDKALAANKKLLKTIKHTKAENHPIALAIEYDYIVTLRNRSHMKETIQHFIALKKRKLVPDYVLAAVADAYLDQKKPKVARDLYLQAIEQSTQASRSPAREWQFGLLQAYLDTYQFTEAELLIEQLQKEIPPVLHQGLHRVAVNNENYERIQADAARIKLYADQLDESQLLLEKTLDHAPFNTDARLILAELQQNRDQPRKAQQQFTKILVDNPANIYAAVGIAQSAIELGDYATARYYLNILNQHYPENTTVQRTQKTLQIYSSRPQFFLVTNKGQSSNGGGNRGNADYQIETTLYSRPIHDNYRAFLQTFNATSDFDNMVSTRRRLGIGGQYKTPDWQLLIELNQDQNSFNNSGIRLAGTKFINDHWQLTTEYESNSNNIPLQAHANAIDAKSLNVGLSFNRNESYKLGMNFSQLWLSDNNRRTAVEFSWFERWRSHSQYKLDTQLTLSGSHNSRQQVDYFNPRNDISLTLLAINEWTLWRSTTDQRSFQHRLTLGVGAYKQQGFANKETLTARYEQQWNFDTRRSLSYGIDYTRHPYDGTTNQRTAFFLELNWHF